MKKTTKTISILFSGLALTIGIAISGGIIRNSYVADEAVAVQGDLLKTFNSDIVVTDSAYKMYENTDWLVTVGGNQKSIGTNSGAASSAKLGSYSYVAAFDSNIGSNTTFLSAVISKKAISNVGKISLSRANTGGGEYATTKLHLAYCSTANGSYQLIQTLTSIPTTATNYEFATIPGANYYAFVFQASAWFRVDDFVANFYEGAPLKLLQSITVESEPIKKEYYVGESIDIDGLVVKANYDIGDSVVVTNACTFSPSVFTVAGVNISVIVSFTDTIKKEATISGFSVIERLLVSLEVTTNPTKMIYTVGESFDSTGMVIKAIYDLGNPVFGYSNYSYSPYGVFSNIGSITITITSLENESITASLLVQVVNQSNINITVADTGYELTSYKTTALTFSKSGVEFSIINFLKPAGSSNMQFRTGTTDAFSFHNSTVLPGIISKVTVRNISGSPTSMTLYTGTATQASSTTGGTEATFNSSDKTFSWNVNTASQSKYLRLFNFAGSAACIFSSIEIEYLVEPEANTEAVAYGTSFLNATSDGCTAKSSSQLSSAWNGLETSYNALSSEAKAYLSSLTPNENGNDAEHAVARYIYIVGKYSLNNYMSLVILGSSPVGNLEKVDVMQIMTVAVVSAIGFAVLLSYLYVNKKKQS